MKYTRLGNSGLKISRIILGCMSYGTDTWGNWVLKESEALPLFKAAWDAGIQTWDTADVYSNGISETLVGKAIKKYNIPREKLVILTKCHGLLHDDPEGGHVLDPKLIQTKEYVNKRGLSRKHIFEAVEASLKRLDVDYIDVLQIHRYDYDTPREETMRALHDLVTSGKVRYIGASSMFAYQFLGYQHVAEINGWTKFISMQNQYSLIYREEEREMIPACKDQGVGCIPWWALAGGILARGVQANDTKRSSDAFVQGMLSSKEFDAFGKDIVNRIEELSKKKGVSMAQISTAWVLANETVSGAILGLSSVKRIDDAVAALEVTLTDEEKKYLEEPYQPRSIAGHF